MSRDLLKHMFTHDWIDTKLFESQIAQIKLSQKCSLW